MGREPLRTIVALVCLALMAAACGSGDDGETGESTRASEVSSTALANSQSGSIEVLAYDDNPDSPGLLDMRPYPDPLPVRLSIDMCEQVDIVRWRLTGSVETTEDGAEGFLQFRAGDTRPMIFQVRVVHSGTFDIEVPTHELSDLATTCQLLLTDGDDGWLPEADAAAQAYQGVFTWDAEPGSVASLGVGLVAGDPDDARRGWAQHHWFGGGLPFGEVVAMDKALVGVPVVTGVSGSGGFTPCAKIDLSFDVAEVEQSEACTPASTILDPGPVGVDAEWQRYGDVAGLTFSSQGLDYLVGSLGQWNITIVARRPGDVAIIASGLQLYDNPGPWVPDRSQARPIDEDELVENILGDQYREIGRFDAEGDRYLAIEGPLNPDDPSDYLLQVRILRLDRAGRFLNPLLVAGTAWDRCLGVAPLGDDRSFVVTGDSGVDVQGHPALPGAEVAGRVRLVDGVLDLADLELVIDGEVVECTPPPPPSVPTTSATSPSTTTGTVPGSTDTTTPGGTTDTTAP